jgi:hypothetical protein
MVNGLLTLDVNNNRQLFNSLSIHTQRLRRERRYKELFRDYFICWCFYRLYEMKQRNEIDRVEYFTHTMNFFKYCNMRFMREVNSIFS